MSASLDKKQTIIVLKDVPYGSQRVLDALSFCERLLREGEEVMIVLEGDSVSMGRKGRRMKSGFISMEAVFSDIISKGARVMTSSACTLARGFSEDELLKGVEMTGVLDIKDWIEEGREVLML